MLGRDRPRGLGARNITIIISVLFAYVFGNTAWGQLPDAPTGARVTFAIVFALFGGGAVWLVYLIVKLLGRFLRKGNDS